MRMTGAAQSRALLIAGLLLGASTGDGVSAPAATRAAVIRVYVGTYTEGESRGIYPLRLDLATGALSVAGEPTAAVNPSFLALHPSGRFLYAVNEIGSTPQDPGGAVSAFAVDARTGDLRLLNQQPSGGASPCHLSLDKGGRHLFVANYWGGTIAVLPVGPTGSLGAATSTVSHREQGAGGQGGAVPHPHFIQLDAAERFAVVADLGLDELRTYPFDATRGTLGPPARLRLAAGAGPRHFAFHPDGRHAYVINELDSTIAALTYDPGTGALSVLQTLSTLPGPSEARNSTAELFVRPDGRFLYGSNRGHDSIAIFAVETPTGRLSAVGHESTRGRTPRNFVIDPTGTYLLAANQNSDTITVFRIDAASGRLAAVGKPFNTPRPVCLLMAKLTD